MREATNDQAKEVVMQVDPARVLANVREATTEDLLDRVTVYRAGMEPEAVTMIEAELEDRGVGREEIEAHRQRSAEKVIFLPDGIAAKCSVRRCYRPAVAEGWGMHRLWGLLPVFPRRFYYCEEHRPAEQG